MNSPYVQISISCRVQLKFVYRTKKKSGNNIQNMIERALYTRAMARNTAACIPVDLSLLALLWLIMDNIACKAS